MTQYNEILNVTLALNVLAIAYRCQLYRFLLQIPSSCSSALLLGVRKFQTGGKANGHHSFHDNGSTEAAAAATTSTVTTNTNNEMSRRHFRLLYGTYLPVYLMAVAADWLQGAYKYSVYSAYGYDQRAISILFVAGFGSGMFLGSVTGSLADTWGRKRMACAYCVVYMLSCLAKHFRPFWILLAGRVFGGVATSLLFSVFDSWLIRAHAIQNIDKSYLSQSFSVANFGSSVVAIISGILANWVVGDSHHHATNDDNDDNNSAMTELRPVFWRAAKRWAQEQAFGDHAGPPQTMDDPRWNAAFVYKGGGIRAFDLAQVALLLSFMLALALWDENYGHQLETDGGGSSSSQQKGQKQDNMLSALRAAMVTVWRSPSIFNLCAISSFFEGAMYVFILLWTPALRAVDIHPDVDNYPGSPPLGIVFATFMVCCMLGTSVFSILTSMNVPPARILVFCLLLSTASCAVISQTQNDTACYCAMLLFEFCIGTYYPAMSTVKGSIVAEDQRAAIYSVFRLPLNAVVLVNLLFTTQGYKHSFSICAAMLGLATVFQMQLARWEVRNQNKQETEMALLL